MSQPPPETDIGSDLMETVPLQLDECSHCYETEFNGFPAHLRAPNFSVEPIKVVVDAVRRKSFGCREDLYKVSLTSAFTRNEDHGGQLRDEQRPELKGNEVIVSGSSGESGTVANPGLEAGPSGRSFYIEPREKEIQKVSIEIKIDNNARSGDGNNNNNNGSNNNNNFLRPDVKGYPIGKRKCSHCHKLLDSDESPYQALNQLLIPFLIAGLGNVLTGFIFDQVQKWNVYHEITQLTILVLPLLGLKGNVEMTLASRLSTHTNLGHMDNSKYKRQILVGNMALVQCQASTVGFIAPFMALGLSYIQPKDDAHILSFQEIILLITSAVITANIASVCLGAITCYVVIISRKFGINPDNIATPIAASLGDFTTLILLSCISHLLLQSIHMPVIQCTLLGVLLLLIPLWAHIARKIKFTRDILVTGWIPIVGAMLLQTTGGLITKNALDKYTKVASFQPVINGIGGNLVAIHSSRMSTYLHKYAKKGELPPTDPVVCLLPCDIFCGEKGSHSHMARILLYLSGPSHIFFLVIIKIIGIRYTLNSVFLFIYLTAVMGQVAILMFLAYVLVHWLWKRKINPDNCAIPFLTAFADLIGSSFLALAFFVLELLNDKNAFTDESAPHRGLS